MLFYLKKMWRNLAGGILAATLMISPLYRRAKHDRAKANAIMPLFFHRISKRMFLKCILWLKREGYHFISTEQVLHYLKGTDPIPSQAVWITFDDGWEDNIENVVPIIVKYNIPVTFFISTDPIENGGVFWWSYVSRFGKLVGSNYTIQNIRRISESERQKIVEQLEARFSSQMPREAMTIQQVRSIARLPQVEIGCHTAHHVMMSQCSDQQLEEEIKTSIAKLEGWINKPVKYFSYPDGDYNHRDQEFVQRYGFEIAATTENRMVTRNDNPLALPRFCVRGEGFFCEAKCQMLGIWMPVVMKIEQLMKMEFESEIFFGQLKDIIVELFEFAFAAEIIWKSFIA